MSRIPIHPFPPDPSPLPPPRAGGTPSPPGGCAPFAAPSAFSFFEGLVGVLTSAEGGPVLTTSLRRSITIANMRVYTAFARASRLSSACAIVARRSNVSPATTVAEVRNAASTFKGSTRKAKAARLSEVRAAASAILHESDPSSDGASRTFPKCSTAPSKVSSLASSASSNPRERRQRRVVASCAPVAMGVILATSAAVPCWRKPKEFSRSPPSGASASAAAMSPASAALMSW
mmetsp:Transcript_2587/g.6255  ORF Transcript_2587/g.6255 Transcript_2587/m.6255 type:complete len:233 (-) Transcript_2587:1118-1816(-)